MAITITISQKVAIVAGGTTQQFGVTVADSTGQTTPAQTATWGASAGTITTGGLFTAPAATNAAQTITVTATSTVDSTKSDTATVIVPAIATAVTNVAANIVSRKAMPDNVNDLAGGVAIGIAREFPGYVVYMTEAGEVQRRHVDGEIHVRTKRIMASDPTTPDRVTQPGGDIYALYSA